MTDIKLRSYEYEDLHSMKKAGQTGGGGANWLRDQYKRLHDPDAGDLHTSAELIQDKPSQPETSDHSPLELYEWPKRLSALNKQFEVLNTKDIKLLDPEVQEDYSERFKDLSERFKSAYTKVKEAFASYISEAPNDLAKRNPTEASDNQLTQNLANATNKLNEALEGLESLKQEAMNKIEKTLDERLKDIEGRYKKAILGAQSLGHNEGAIALRKTYLKLFSQFKKVQENSSLTYADRHSHLDKMETKFWFLMNKMDDILYEKVLTKYPAARDQVFQKMQPIKEMADSIHDKQKSVGNPNSMYSPEVRKARFKQVEREFVRRFLTHNYTDANDLHQDLNQLASEVSQVRECCENVIEVETQVRTNLEYMKPILERLTQSGMPANKFDQKWIDTFQNKRRVALLLGSRGTNGQKLEELKQMASEVQQARECCENVTKVETQVRTSLDNILECLPLSDTPAHRFFRHEWWNTFEKMQLEAWHEGTLGTNGPKLKELKQFTSDVCKMGECCEKVTKVKMQIHSDVSDIKSILLGSYLNDELKKVLEAKLQSTCSYYSNMFTTSQDSLSETDRLRNGIQQKLLDNAQQEAVQGTNGQALDRFSHFASVIHNIQLTASAYQGMVNRLLSSMLDIDPI